MSSKSYLMSFSKAELVDKILTLEKNEEILKETINQQYKNAMDIFKGMDLFNKTFESSTKEDVINKQATIIKNVGVFDNRKNL